MRIARHRAPVLVAALLVASTAQAETIRRILAERDGNAPHEPLGQQREPKTCFSQNPA